jgi:hypothetical protein
MIKIQNVFVLILWILDLRACFGFRVSYFEFICKNLLLWVQQGGRVVGIGQIADTHDQNKKDPENNRNNQPVLGELSGFSVSGRLTHHGPSLPSGVRDNKIFPSENSTRYLHYRQK